MTIPTAREAFEAKLFPHFEANGHDLGRKDSGEYRDPLIEDHWDTWEEAWEAAITTLPAPVGDAKGADEFAISVFEDVIRDISGWEDKALAEACEEAITRLRASQPVGDAKDVLAKIDALVQQGEDAFSHDGAIAALLEIRALVRASQPVEAGAVAVAEALRRIEDAIAAFPSLRAPMNGQAHASVTYALNCARDLLSAHPAPPEAVAKEEDALDSSKLFTAVRIAQVLFNAEDLGITTARTAPKDDASVALNAETIDKLHEMFWEAIGVDCDFYTGDVMERWEAMEKTLRDLASRRATYAAANPLGGPAKMFDAIAERLRDGEDYDAVLKDYGVRVETEAKDDARDAARYRWLREANWIDDGVMAAFGVDEKRPDTLDASIDEALRKTASSVMQQYRARAQSSPSEGGT